MILRGRGALALTAMVLLLAGAALGQYRRQPVSQGPRAIAVVEWDAKGVPRLVPISIMIEGKWYDAGLYKADPVPMALEPETVYEATKDGDPVGLFTITGVQQFKDAWYGLGRWREGIEPPKTEAKPQPQKAAPEDDRPRLHRPGAKPETPPAAQPGPQPSAPSAPAPAAKPAEKAQEDEDVNRPILRRGKPAEEQAATIPAPAGPPAGSPAAPGTKPARVLVAISDAKHNDYRPFTWTTKPEELQRVTKLMSDLAAKEASAFAAARPGPKPGALHDVEMRAFDLDLSNEPVFVVTARAGEAPPAAARGRRGAKAAPAQAPAALPPGGVEFYVTVVARQDFNGDMRKLFSAVTDSRHLDAYPRLELVDALDADGNARGELLFRQINDRGRSFVIYRVGADRLAEIFDGSAPMQ